MKKILIVLVLFLELFLFMYSKEVIYEFKNTLNMCLYSLMPTMFFSIFLSNILIKSDFSLPNKINNILNRLFNLNEKDSSILFLSIISGYPNNVKMLDNSKNEVMFYITNYVNPLFLIGTVGTIYLNNKLVAINILICHYISNLIMAFILKKKHKDKTIINKNYNTNMYSNSLYITVKTLSIIFSNLLFISLLVTLLKLTLPFNNNINSIILGILEFSKGIYEVSLTNYSLFIKGLMILIIITFGSISIHFQMISINPKIKYINFLKYRIINVLISIIVYLSLNVLIQVMN